jgi:cobalt-zinc-cadmium efflux system membrane fusion protein
MKSKILYTVILSSMLMACQNAKKAEIDEAEPAQTDIVNLSADQLNALSLQFGDASSASMGSTLRVQGKVDLPPQNLISVNFPMGGYLKQTKLIPGMQVSKGEVIAVIEDQLIIQIQQDFLTAKSRLELASLELERQKSMAEAKAGVARNLQQAEAEFRLQSITVKSLSEKLKLIGIDPSVLNETTISGQVQLRSTINGYVSKVHVNTGKYVQPTETLFELIDPGDIHAALTLFEKDLPYVKKGDKVSIHFHDNRSSVYPAEVILVNRDVDDDRTAIAHCHFEKHPHELLPGMFVEADIKVKNINAKVLPDEAIVRLGNQQYVFIRKSPSEMQMISVQTGLAKDGKTEITGGLEGISNGSIVLNNAYKLLGMIKNSDDEDHL